MSERLAFGLAKVCGEVAYYRALLVDDGSDDSTPLAKLMAAAAAAAVSGRSDSAHTERTLLALLDAVHTAAQSQGDAQGIYGPFAHRSEAVGLKSVEAVYRCPWQRCLGRAESDVTEPRPRCSVSGLELLRERLD
ncbi:MULTISPECIES: hypothetical protein [Streptomyces]|uniref:Uncharacterized protein n=1 Tax=Streptomyces bobili TaxID=67280 RepID=A0ABZ1RB49_9ACTN|nr:hypothetical protein [Streptomyces bobili]